MMFEVCVKNDWLLWFCCSSLTSLSLVYENQYKQRPKRVDNSSRTIWKMANFGRARSPHWSQVVESHLHQGSAYRRLHKADVSHVG